jgi:hypothetical protein
MELLLHNNISEEQTLWWNLYSVTMPPMGLTYNEWVIVVNISYTDATNGFNIQWMSDCC